MVRTYQSPRCSHSGPACAECFVPTAVNSLYDIKPLPPWVRAGGDAAIARAVRQAVLVASIEGGFFWQSCANLLRDAIVVTFKAVMAQGGDGSCVRFRQVAHIAVAAGEAAARVYMSHPSTAAKPRAVSERAKAAAFAAAADTTQALLAEFTLATSAAEAEAENDAYFASHEFSLPGRRGRGGEGGDGDDAAPPPASGAQVG